MDRISFRVAVRTVGLIGFNGCPVGPGRIWGCIVLTVRNVRRSCEKHDQQQQRASAPRYCGVLPW